MMVTVMMLQGLKPELQAKLERMEARTPKFDMAAAMCPFRLLDYIFSYTAEEPLELKEEEEEPVRAREMAPGPESQGQQAKVTVAGAGPTTS